MYYPETSPSAPVSRDDLAAILAMQQQGPDMNAQQQQQPWDPQDEFERAAAIARANYQGHSPAAADIVSGPGSPGWDPASESPSFTEPDAVGVPGFGRGGDDTSQASQDKQAADRAALAESVSGRGPIDFNTGFNDRASIVSAPGRGAIDVFSSGHPSWGSPALTPLSTFDPFEGAPVTPTSIPTPTPTLLPEMVVTAPLPGRATPTPTGRATPTGSGDPGGVSTGAGSPGGGGFGGGIDMSATGGFEGSASVGNTTGAAGFTSPGGGSGFGNVGGSQGSYGSYAGSAPSDFGAPGGGFASTGGFEGGAPSGFGGGAVGGFGGGGGLGGADGAGGGGGGGGGMGGGGGPDAGGSPGGVG